MTNPTARTFGFPRTLVAQTDYWLVLVRPKQPTYGSLVLICKEPATAVSEVSSEAFADLKLVTTGIERMLRQAVAYDKINYLLFMMVDPDVHFHVIPRYAGPRVFDGVTFTDEAWPAPPNLAAAKEMTPEAAETLAAQLAQVWAAA